MTPRRQSPPTGAGTASPDSSRRLVSPDGERHPFPAQRSDLGPGDQPAGHGRTTGPTAGQLAGDVRRLLRRAGRPRPFPFGAPTWPGTVPRPVHPTGLGDSYDTRWARRYPVRLARAMVTDNVTRPAVHLLAAPRVRGAELLDLVEQPVLLVANHASHVDTPLLLSVLPNDVRHRTAVAAAADHFFDRRWKAHLWAGLLGAIPMERQRVSRRSADLAADLVDDGWNLVVFPEGGRSTDGWQQAFHGGAAYLAVRTGRPVVPVHIDGTHRILPKDGGRLRRGTTTVAFGTPLYLDDGEGPRRFASRIEAAVSALAAEARTDWWSARRAAARTDVVAGARGPAAAAWRRAWALDDRAPGTTVPGITTPGTTALGARNVGNSNARDRGIGDDDPARWAVRGRRRARRPETAPAAPVRGGA